MSKKVIKNLDESNLEKKVSKKAIIRSIRFASHARLLGVLLEDGHTYSEDEVLEIKENYNKLFIKNYK